MRKTFIAAAAAIMTVLGACTPTPTGEVAASADTVAESDMPQIIRLNVFFTIADEANRTQAVEVAKKLVEASRNDAGCISYDFLQSATVPGEYMIIETWENDSLLDLHSKAPHFTEYVPILNNLGVMHTERFLLDK